MAKSKQETLELQEPQDTRTVADLVSFLRTSGTSESRLKKVEWLAQDGVTLTDLYQAMEANDLPLGTLSKVGKWIWGDSFEPKIITQQDAQERLASLALENETLKKRVQNLESDNGAIKRQLTLLSKKNADLTAELGIYNPVHRDEMAGIH